MGRTGPRLLPGRRPLVLGARTSPGPWTFATPKLPEDFKKIPLEHPRSRVLASVPGTPQAAEAVLLAQVPQTARVNKKEVKAPEVDYQGEPKFEPIDDDDGRAGRQHRQGHHQGRRPLLHVLPGRVVHGAERRQGPWEVTEHGAEGDLRDPGQLARRTTSPTSRSRTTTQRRVGDLRGRRRLHRHDGRVGLRGVGHAATTTRPTAGYGGYYPYYYPYYPDLRLRRLLQPVDRRLRPRRRRRTDRTAAPASARGTTRAPAPTRAARRRGDPYGARGAAEAYNPRTGAYGATRQGSNVYGSWGSDRRCSAATTGRAPRASTNNAHRQHDARHAGQRRRRGGHAARAGRAAAASRAPAAATSTPAATATSTGRRATAGSTTTAAAAGTTRTGQRPNAIRPRARATTASPRTTESGSGARAGGDSTISQLDRDRAARTDGATRTRDAGTYRSGSGSTSRGGSSYGGSYRPSGGGMRGGGGRRR